MLLSSSEKTMSATIMVKYLYMVKSLESTCKRIFFLVNLPTEEVFSRTHSDLFSSYFVLQFLRLLLKYIPYKSCFPYLIYVVKLGYKNKIVKMSSSNSFFFFVLKISSLRFITNSFQNVMKELRKLNFSFKGLVLLLFTFRNSHQRCSIKKAYLKNQACNFLKRDSNTGVFL